MEAEKVPGPPAGSGHAAHRSPPGERSDFRPTDRPCLVDLDAFFGAAAPAPEVPPATPSTRPSHRGSGGSESGGGGGSDGFVGVDGVAAVRRPGRLVTSGEVFGRLHRWEKSTSDAWIAIVSFVVPFVDDPRPGQRADFVPVAANAVRARNPDSPGPRPPAAPGAVGSSTGR